MGLFDGNPSGMFSDPTTMALLGAMAGTSQFAGASRLPQTWGQALGGMAGGLMGGARAGQQYQLGQQELTQAAINNANALDSLRTIQAVYGAPLPSQQDITSGRWQGTPNDILQRMVKQWMSGGGMAPSSAPQLPGAPLSGGGPGPALPGADAESAGRELQNVPANTMGQGLQRGRYQAPPAGVGGASYAALASQKAQELNVDPDFFTTQIHAESGFNPLATGPATTGAGEPQERPLGIAQIKPSTAKEWRVDPLNPDSALGGAAKFIADKVNGGNTYVEAAQAYGTIPHDLSRMDGNQRQVYEAARAADQKRMQYAQAGGMTATDAASGMPAQPGVAGAQAQLGAGNMGLPNPGQMMLNNIIGSRFGFKPTPAESAFFAASRYPEGSMTRNVLMNEALKGGGIRSFIGGERRGSPIFRYNPQTNSYDLAVQNPQLPEGAIEGPGGEISMAPHAADVIRQVEEAKRAGKARYEPQTGVIPEGQPGAGTPYAIPRSEAFAPNAPPIITGLAPGTKETQQKSAALPYDIAKEQYKPENITPGHGLFIPQFPGGIPAPTSVRPPSVGGGFATGLPGPAAPAGAGQPAPGGVAGTPSPLVPGGATQGAAGGMVVPGMTPGQIGTQEERSKHQEKVRQQNIDFAKSAQVQNSLIDRMVLDVGRFPQGPLGPHMSTAQSYLRYFDPTFNEPVATGEEFNKNAGVILRQVVHDTSTRAAVQEYKLIGGTLPAQENSPMGTIRVLGEFRGLNDFMIARAQAQEMWENAHGGDIGGFETHWQRAVSPDAFLMYRMTPQDRQNTIDQLRATEEGRSKLKTLGEQMQYLKNSGIEKAIQ